MTVAVRTAAGLEWYYSGGMWPLTITGGLAMTAMDSPAFIALFVFVAEGDWLGATMINTRGSKC